MSDRREQARTDIEALVGIEFYGDDMIIHDQNALKNFYYTLIEQATNQLARAEQSRH